MYRILDWHAGSSWFNPQHHKNQVWWSTPPGSASSRQRHEDHKSCTESVMPDRLYAHIYEYRYILAKMNFHRMLLPEYYTWFQVYILTHKADGLWNYCSQVDSRHSQWDEQTVVGSRDGARRRGRQRRPLFLNSNKIRAHCHSSHKFPGQAEDRKR